MEAINVYGLDGTVESVTLLVERRSIAPDFLPQLRERMREVEALQQEREPQQAGGSLPATLVGTICRLIAFLVTWLLLLTSERDNLATG